MYIHTFVSQLTVSRCTLLNNNCRICRKIFLKITLFAYNYVEILYVGRYDTREKYEGTIEIFVIFSKLNYRFRGFSSRGILSVFIRYNSRQAVDVLRCSYSYVIIFSATTYLNLISTDIDLRDRIVFLLFRLNCSLLLLRFSLFVIRPENGKVYR